MSRYFITLHKNKGTLLGTVFPLYTLTRYCCYVEYRLIYKTSEKKQTRTFAGLLHYF